MKKVFWKLFLKIYKFYFGIKVKFMSRSDLVKGIRKDCGLDQIKR